jgi:hypothetical protein
MTMGVLIGCTIVLAVAWLAIAWDAYGARRRDRDGRR